MSKRLDLLVVERVPLLSRSRAAALIRDGAVTVEGEVVTRPAARIAEDARIDVTVPPPAPAETQAEDLPIHIVYQDDDIAVINKAPGMVVHPSVGHASGTLVNALLFHLDGLSGIGGVERPGIVHRLDKPTSGLLVVAKNDRAHQSLAEQFADHSAGRHYLAICAAVPDRLSGTISTRLARHPSDRIRYASTEHPERGKLATTHWKRLAHHGGSSLLACRLETGRTHQVRVHLCEAGWPLLGDDLYKRRHRGVPPAARPLVTRCMLHAWQLRLTHPDGRAMTFEAPPPDDFERVLDALGLAFSP